MLIEKIENDKKSFIEDLIKIENRKIITSLEIKVRFIKCFMH